MSGERSKGGFTAPEVDRLRTLARITDYEELKAGCAQGILNTWREIEPATPYVLAHMAAEVAARFYLEERSREDAQKRAVVRPTREQIAELVYPEIEQAVFTSTTRLEATERVADALLAEFWPGTPEETQ